MTRALAGAALGVAATLATLWLLGLVLTLAVVGIDPDMRVYELTGVVGWLLTGGALVIGAAGGAVAAWWTRRGRATPAQVLAASVVAPAPLAVVAAIDGGAQMQVLAVVAALLAPAAAIGIRSARRETDHRLLFGTVEGDRRGHR